MRNLKPKPKIHIPKQYPVTPFEADDNCPCGSVEYTRANCPNRILRIGETCQSWCKPGFRSPASFNPRINPPAATTPWTKRTNNFGQSSNETIKRSPPSFLTPSSNPISNSYLFTFQCAALGYDATDAVNNPPIFANNYPTQCIPLNCTVPSSITQGITDGLVLGSWWTKGYEKKAYLAWNAYPPSGSPENYTILSNSFKASELGSNLQIQCTPGFRVQLKRQTGTFTGLSYDHMDGPIATCQPKIGNSITDCNGFFDIVTCNTDAKCEWNSNLLFEGADTSTNLGQTAVDVYYATTQEISKPTEVNYVQIDNSASASSSVVTLLNQVIYREGYYQNVIDQCTAPGCDPSIPRFKCDASNPIPQSGQVEAATAAAANGEQICQTTGTLKNIKVLHTFWPVCLDGIVTGTDDANPSINTLMYPTPLPVCQRLVCPPIPLFPSYAVVFPNPQTTPPGAYPIFSQLQSSLPGTLAVSLNPYKSVISYEKKQCSTFTQPPTSTTIYPNGQSLTFVANPPNPGVDVFVYLRSTGAFQEGIWHLKYSDAST